MSPRDTLSALLTATVWGLTFVAIKFGVGEAPPFLLTALRFAFAAVPAVFFIKPPAATPALVVLYGLLIGVGQFGLLFVAFGLGMSVGLASVVMQLQAFFTILLAWAFMRERPTRRQTIATIITFAGVGVIGAARLGGVSFWPFAMTLAAAFCWGAGNLVGKLAGRVDPLAFMVWSSLVAPAPMFALSLIFEHGRTLPALLHPTAMLIICVIVISYGGTLLGFGLWSRLLMHYPAAVVAPFALLTPVVGMVAARLIFGETLSPIEFAGAILVMAGLSFNVLGGPRARPKRVSHARYQDDTG
jgi:O-acetylserine/cysteine efflux transporter